MAREAMNIDSRSDFSQPATGDEQIVASKVLGACTHRDWSEFRDRRDARILVCSDCKEEFNFCDGVFGQAEPLFSPSDFLLRFVPHASQNELLAATVLRRIESAGWSSMLRTGFEGYVQLLSHNGVRFASASHSTKAEAICDAAAQLCRSGRLKLIGFL